jgi:hypothetical protein
MSAADYSDSFRQCLVDVDVTTMRKLWAYVAPHLPQPESDAEVEATIHHARTQANSILFKQRAYSHAWLLERGLPSGLPDNKRPRAERMYPRVVAGVGISVNAINPELEPLTLLVRGAMEDAVRELHADGRMLDTPLVKQRMEEARRRIYKRFW